MGNWYKHHPVSAQPCLSNRAWAGPRVPYLTALPWNWVTDSSILKTFSYSSRKKHSFHFAYLGGSDGCLLCQTYLDFRELLLNQEANLIPVVPRVIEAAAGGLPISPSSARLLVISCHWLGNVPMSNKPASDNTMETQGFLNSGRTQMCSWILTTE